MHMQLLELAASIVASQLVGIVYYSPYLLGRVWMRHQFPGRRNISAGAGAYVVSILSYASLAIVLQYLLQTCFKVTNMTIGMQIGLGLSALISLANIPHLMFGQNSFVVFFIDRVYDTLVLISMITCLLYF